MSNIWTPTNQGRIEKIADLLDKLTVSATSNGADGAVMAMMLVPVMGKIEQLVGQPTPVPTPPPVAGGHTQRRDISLWDQAKTAPLHELMMAYTTITSRLTDLVDERKNQ